MQIAFHLGMPYTDKDQLLWSLRRDRQALDEAGVHIPRPRFYRDRLAKAVTSLRGAAPTEQEQLGILEEIGAREGTLRMVLSDPQFICGTKRIWHDFEFYGKAGFKTGWLRNVFSQHETEFFICIRNPVSFLSELLTSNEPMTLDEHLCGADPGAMYWSDVIARILEANPGCPVVVWCHEDAPTIWPLVLAAVAGVETDVPFAGSDRLLRPLLTEMGQNSLTAGLGDPVDLPAHLAVSVLERHLALFADPEQVDEDVVLPGWTDAHVEAMTLAYDEDIERIARLPGVVFLRPETASEMFQAPQKALNIF